MPFPRTTRHDLLELLGAAGYVPGRLKELARALGVDQPGYRDLRRLVKELEREGLVVRLRNSRYALPGQVRQRVGVLRVHPRGFSFIAVPGAAADLFVPRDAKHDAIDGDTVRVEVVTDGPGGTPEGRVLEVVTPTARRFPGSLVRTGRRAAVEVDGGILDRQVRLDSGQVRDLADGTRVLVAVTERGWGDDGLRGEVVEVLGDPDDPRLDFPAVVRRYELPDEFPPAALAEAAALVSASIAASGVEAGSRLDLRAVRSFTVDPETARDYDDAVSLEPGTAGGWQVGVHIADVSHFVRPDTELDREARRRGTSVYLLDRVLHMLPEPLAGGLCTLKPGEDRLTLSVLIDLDDEGVVQDFRLVESIVHSAARLTYEQVQAVFDGRSGEAGSATALAEELEGMRRVSLLRRALRRARGALDFDLPEPRVDLDADSRPVALGRQPRLESQRLIEEFMLLANECVGQHAARHRLPVLYRIHRPPDREKLARILELAPGGARRGRTGVSPAELQRLLAELADRPDGPLLHRLVLQSLMRAEYAVDDVGHFGLACRRYVHFTSPIRRYPDLYVHRVLKQTLSAEGAVEAADGEMGLAELARSSSRAEQRAEEAERTYTRTKQLRFLEERLGQVFPGVVSGVVRGGFFVEVDGFMVEGFCPVRGLDDWYEFDERRRRLVGRRTRRTIQLGQRLQVRVTGVDWRAQDLDLVWVDRPASRPPVRTGRGRPPRPRLQRRRRRR
ncbi:MAG: ribonuclease R [Candidatus Latescibacterota bacterium]